MFIFTYTNLGLLCRLPKSSVTKMILNWQKNFYVGKRISEKLSFIYVYNFQPSLFVILVCTKFEDVACFHSIL